MTIVNLTPHPVNIILGGKVVKSYAPSGKVAKLEEWDATVTLPDRFGNFLLDGYPVVRKLYGRPVLLDRTDFLSGAKNPPTEALPEEQEGVAYLVPMLVGQQLAGKRDDLYGPDAGIGGVRTADGSAKGAAGFIKY